MENLSQTKLIALDYDGTLARNNSKVHENELQQLKRLGQKGVHRVIATGRSLFSADEVLSADTPIDYLVFSSGIGVMEWKTRRLLSKHCMDADLVQLLINDLVGMHCDFMVHHQAPENHHFHFYKDGTGNPDFYRRIDKYPSFGTDLKHNAFNGEASQLLIIVERNGQHLLRYLEHKYPQINVVRTTSPLDNKSMWIELFPRHVSKAGGVQFLAEKLFVDTDSIVCVGNDFNDLDMLRYAPQAYVVDNAPQELKQEFKSIDSNENGGVGNLLKHI